MEITHNEWWKSTRTRFRSTKSVPTTHKSKLAGAFRGSHIKANESRNTAILHYSAIISRPICSLPTLRTPPPPCSAAATHTTPVSRVRLLVILEREALLDGQRLLRAMRFVRGCATNSGAGRLEIVDGTRRSCKQAEGLGRRRHFALWHTAAAMIVNPSLALDGAGRHGTALCRS